MKKKILAALLTVAMIAGLLCVPAMAADEGTFPDVAGDAWYAGAVERWAGNKILNGNPDGTFNPEGDMTRAQFAKVVVELLGLPHESRDVTFDDVIGTKDDWAAEYIAAANKAGIVNGASATKFNPGKAVSFNDSAAMLGRALGLVDSKAYGDPVTKVLDELGMLDDHVNADATANRALVAALADNMIGAYVTPDTVDTETAEGVITGDVKGVILVRGDVEVEIKDITTAAPIVVDSASVTLTGVTAGDVKVVGEKAAVTADKDSKVENVSIAATDAKVELNGEVAKVVVEAEAAGDIDISGDGVTADTVDNTAATTDITVKGETVEKPAEPENPDDNQGDDETSTGFVPTPATPPAESTSGTSGGAAAAEDRNESDVPSGNIPAVGAATGEVVVPEGKTACDPSHNWNSGEITTMPTCTTTGVVTYTCQEETCQATKTGVVAKLDHDFTNSDRMKYNDTQHWKLCKYCSAEDTTKEDHGSFTYTAVSGTNLHTEKCACGHSVNEAHSQADVNDAGSWDTTTNANFHWAICQHCDAKYGQAVHSYTEGTCACGKTQAGGGESDEHEHVWETTAFSGKDETHHWHICTVDGCTDVTATNPGDATAKEENGYTTHTASTNPEVVTSGEWVCDVTNGVKSYHKTCSVCGKTYDNRTTCPLASGHKNDGTVCELCGYHTCVAASDAVWQKGTNGHYHLCKVDGCTEQTSKAENQKLDYQAHGVADGTANGGWSKNGTTYEQKCSTCQAVIASQNECPLSHSGISATNPCTLCGATEE